MSGGSFDYIYSRISMFGEDLSEKLNTTPNEWSPEVTEKLYDIVDIIEYASMLAKEVEWLYSGDIGEESFLKYLSEIEKQHELIHDCGGRGNPG